MLHERLPNLSLEYFKVGASGVRASDVVPLIDNQTRGWSPWPDTRAHDLLLNFYFATACMIPYASRLLLSTPRILFSILIL